METEKLTATTLNDEMRMDWNDTVCDDGPELVLLEEGDYDFKVVNFRCGSYPGSEKLPACNKITLTLAVYTDKGVGIVWHDLVLYRTLEWRLASFFRCIGMKKPGQSMVMDWNSVPGRMGRARFKPRTYINRKGEEQTVNDVVRFYDWEPGRFSETPDWLYMADGATSSCIQGAM